MIKNGVYVYKNNFNNVIVIKNGMMYSRCWSGARIESPVFDNYQKLLDDEYEKVPDNVTLLEARKLTAPFTYEDEPPPFGPSAS